MEELIAKRYVAALLESKVDLKEIEDILSSLENIILNDKKVKEVIYSPLIKSSQKYELLIAPIEKKLSKEMKNFFKVLAQKDRLALIPQIRALLQRELKLRSNSFEGVIESQEKLDKKTIKLFEDSLSKYSNATIKLIPKESDYDGVRVEVEDLGIELNFSKSRVKEALIQFIEEAI